MVGIEYVEVKKELSPCLSIDCITGVISIGLLEVGNALLLGGRLVESNESDNGNSSESEETEEALRLVVGLSEVVSIFGDKVLFD